MSKRKAKHPVLPGPTIEDRRIACGCGFSVTVTVRRIVDTDRDAKELKALQEGRLNQVRCPRCKAEHTLECPVAVYDPGRQAVFLCVPEAQRHRTLRLLADLFRGVELVVGGGPLGRLVVRPFLVGGGCGLAEAQEVHEQEAIATAAAAERAAEQQEARGELDVRSEALAEREAALGLREQTLEEARHEHERLRRQADELNQALDGRETDLVSRGERLDIRDRELDAREAELNSARAELDAQEEGLSARETDLSGSQQAVDDLRRKLEARVGDMVAGRQPPTEPYPALDRAKVDVEDATPTVVTEPVAPEAEERTLTEPDVPPADQEDVTVEEGEQRTWSPAIDEAWDLDVGGRRPPEEPAEAPAKVAGADHAPTSRFTYPEGGAEGRRDTRDVEVLAPEPAVGPFSEFDAELADGRPAYATLHGEEVFLCHKVPGPQLDDLLARRLDLRVQLHRTDHDAVVALLLVCTDGEEEQEALWWLLDHGRETDRDVLERLGEHFAPSVVLFDGDRRPRRRLPFQRPLEENVRLVLDEAERWRQGRRKPDWPRAAALVDGEGFDRVGAMQHPFAHEEFALVTSPEQARIRSGVLDYWTEADNRDYLTLVKCLPLQDLERVQRRLLEAALHFGVGLAERTASLAVELGLARSRKDLLQRLIAAFAETVLKLKTGGEPHDLGDVGEWDNWQALIEQADSEGVDIDPSILSLAEGSMERVRSLVEDAPPDRTKTPPARRLAPSSPSSPSSPAPEPLAPGAGGTAVLSEDDLLPVQEGDLEELSTDGLIKLLDQDDLALDAAKLLGRRGGLEVARALVTRIASGDGKGRLLALDVLGELGDEALRAVCDGVKSRRRGVEVLDDAVAALDRAVGRKRLERLAKDRSRKVRDVARRVLARMREADQPTTEDGGGGEKTS